MSDLAQSLSWGRDEADLVHELQAGSDAAFDYLVTYYHAGVFNLVYGILSDRADAADVTQEVFLRAFRGIRGFRHGSSLKTWLYRISVRQALNHRRWCWRHHRQQVSIDAEEEGKSLALDLKDSEATPYERLASQETQQAVRAALAQVPALFRSAVISAGSRRAFLRRGGGSARSLGRNRKVAHPSRTTNAQGNSRSSRCRGSYRKRILGRVVRLTADQWVGTMNCKSAQRFLPGYLDGAIGSREHARVRLHVESCDGCRNLLESYRRLVVALARVEPIRPPANLATAFA